MCCKVGFLAFPVKDFRVVFFDYCYFFRFENQRENVKNRNRQFLY